MNSLLLTKNHFSRLVEIYVFFVLQFTSYMFLEYNWKCHAKFDKRLKVIYRVVIIKSAVYSKKDICNHKNSKCVVWISEYKLKAWCTTLLGSKSSETRFLLNMICWCHVLDTNTFKVHNFSDYGLLPQRVQFLKTFLGTCGRYGLHYCRHSFLNLGCILETTCFENTCTKHIDLSRYTYCNMCNVLSAISPNTGRIGYL